MEFLKARPLPWDDPTRSYLASSSLRQNSPLGWGRDGAPRERMHKILFTCDGRAGGRWRTKQITNLCLTVTEVLMFISWNLEMCDVINIFKSQSDGMKRLINSTLKAELHQSMQYSQCGNGNISNGWKFTKAFLFFLVCSWLHKIKQLYWMYKFQYWHFLDDYRRRKNFWSSINPLECNKWHLQPTRRPLKTTADAYCPLWITELW